MNNRTSWTRWLRFSLRSFLLLPILAAAVLGVIANGAHRQRTAVAEIEQQGGWVKYDFQLHGFKPPGGPYGLLKRLGVDYSNRVVQASIPGDSRVVQRLPGLRFVELVGDRVVESRLEPLRRLRQLERLHLRSGSISEQGLEYIADIPNLMSLDLGSTKLNGASLSPLHTASVENLFLTHADPQDTHVPELIALQNLKVLRVPAEGLSQQSLESLRTHFADRLTVRLKRQGVRQPATAADIEEKLNRIWNQQVTKGLRL